MPKRRTARRTTGSTGRGYYSYTPSRRGPARNRRKFRLKKLLWPMMAAVVLSAIGTCCYYVLTSPRLRVEEVRVTGTKLLDRAKVEMDARMAIGRNILILPKGRIAGLVKSRPEVRGVRVGRLLPHTVVVQVAEREPYVTLANGRGFWLVDKGGVAFHRVGRSPDGIPTVALPSETEISSGVRIKNASFTAALSCIEVCRLLGTRVAKISVDRMGNLCLNMGSGFYVKLGQPVEIQQKLSRASKILTARPEARERALYIDVSCYERPVWKLKA